MFDVSQNGSAERRQLNTVEAPRASGVNTDSRRVWAKNPIVLLLSVFGSPRGHTCRGPAPTSSNRSARIWTPETRWTRQIERLAWRAMRSADTGSPRRRREHGPQSPIRLSILGSWLSRIWNNVLIARAGDLNGRRALRFERENDRQRRREIGGPSQREEPS